MYDDDNHLGLLWSTYILSIIFFVIYLVTKPFALDDVDKFACVMQGTLSLILLLTIVLYVEDNLDRNLRARWDRDVLSGFLIFLSMALGPVLFFFYARLVHGGAPTTASRPLMSVHIFDSLRTSMRGRYVFGERGGEGPAQEMEDGLDIDSPTEDDDTSPNDNIPLGNNRRLRTPSTSKEVPEDVEDAPLNFQMTPLHDPDAADDGKDSQQDSLPENDAAADPVVEGDL